MSQAIEIVGSTAGSVVGVLSQFVASLATAAYHGSSDDFLHAFGFLVLSYIAFKILKRTVVVLAGLFKLLLIGVVIALAYAGYQAGPERSTAAAHAFTQHLVNQFKAFYLKFAFYHGLFHQHLQSELKSKVAGLKGHFSS